MLRSGFGYALFTLLAALGPGVTLQCWLTRSVDPALVIPLGTAVAAGAYWLSLACGAPWLFPAVVAVGCAGFLLPRARWTRASGPSLRGAVAPIAALVAVLAVTQYPWNRLADNGEFVLDPLVPFDTAFHVGVARELTLGYPPQVPGVAGFPLGYHLGTDLVRAGALRWASVDPYGLVSRFDVTLFALALLLAAHGVTARLGGSATAATLAGWTLLATDLSFLFGG